jgi:hypothetical protein
MRKLEYYAGTIHFVRDDDDEIVAAFAAAHERAAERFIADHDNALTFDSQDGHFVRLYDAEYPARTTPWAGPFEDLEEAREYVREELQLDPKTGRPLIDEMAQYVTPEEPDPALELGLGGDFDSDFDSD